MGAAKKNPKHDAELMDLLNDSIARNEYGAIKPKKVVVLDDDKDFVTYMKAILTKVDNTVFETYTNEIEAMGAVLYDEDVDLFVVDIQMEKFDGFQIGDLIRSAREKEIPIIFITALNSNLLPFYKKSLTNSYFLPKPFDPKSFVRIMDRMI